MINYRKDAAQARTRAGALSIFAIVLALLFFFALTDSWLRAALATVSLGLLMMVGVWIGDFNRQAMVYDAQVDGPEKLAARIREAVYSEELKSGSVVQFDENGKVKKS